MIQTKIKTASIKTRTTTQPKKIPFDTSVRRDPEDKHAIINLMGTFTGTPKDFDTVEFAFMSQVIGAVPEIHLKVSETFYANGHRVSLAEAIVSHASRHGKKIIPKNIGDWGEALHVFSV